jgi:hypothetical protein
MVDFKYRYFIVVRISVSSAAVWFHIHNSLFREKKTKIRNFRYYYYRKLIESLVWKDVPGWAAREIAEQNQTWSWLVV